MQSERADVWYGSAPGGERSEHTPRAFTYDSSVLVLALAPVAGYSVALAVLLRTRRYVSADGLRPGLVVGRRFSGMGVVLAKDCEIVRSMTRNGRDTRC